MFNSHSPVMSRVTSLSQFFGVLKDATTVSAVYLQNLIKYLAQFCAFKIFLFLEQDAHSSTKSC